MWDLIAVDFDLLHSDSLALYMIVLLVFFNIAGTRLVFGSDIC